MADDAPVPGAAAPTVETRADLLAKFKAAPTAEVSQAPAPPPPSPSTTGERAPATVDEDADPVDTDADPDATTDDDAIVDEDGETQDLKGHQAVKRAEVRMRAQLADERAKMQAELDRAVAEIRPRLDRLQKLEQLAERGRTDFDAAAEFFGWTDEDMETIGHSGFARSPKYKDKPEMKAYATRAMRERAEREERAKISKRQDDLEAEIKRRDAEAAQTAARTRWLGGVKKLVDDKAPLTKRLIEKSPAKADRLLAETALAMWEKTGAQPSDAAVVRELEKRRAAHRAEFVDEEPVAAADPKKPVGKADPKKPDAKPTNGANSAPKFKTRDEALAAFRAGQLE